MKGIDKQYIIRVLHKLIPWPAQFLKYRLLRDGGHFFSEIEVGRRSKRLGSSRWAHKAEDSTGGFKTGLLYDISESMLAISEQRRKTLPDALSARLRFVGGDIRSFRAGADFADTTLDVVLSLFHVFSYQTTNDDLQAAFATAAAHLRPGGLLIFDFWYGPAVLTQLPEVRVKRLADATTDILRIAEPLTDQCTNTVQVNYTVLVTDRESAQVQQLSERHTLRYLFLPEIELLSSPYFRTKTRLGWRSSAEPGCDDWAAACVMEAIP